MDNSNKHSKTPVRIPLHQRNVLKTAHREGYVRRFVNETEGRIAAFLAAGWTPVKGEENDLSDVRVQSSKQLGSVIRKEANKKPVPGLAKTAILMEISKELFDLDQKEKQKINDDKEASFNPKKKSQTGSDYGSVTISDETKRKQG